MRARLVTAVALYGPKSGALRDLLVSVQGIIRERLGERFLPYTLDQIHGTLIRFDGAVDPRTGAVVSQRYLEVTGRARPMDHARALAILTRSLTPPLAVRVGGYGPATPAAFTSRGQHPHQRMFSAQGQAFVLVGWPVVTTAEATAPRPLDELRRRMGEANILHWYHGAPGEIDNDLHMVVGHHGAARPGEIAETVSAVRAHLARCPAEFAVGTEQVTVIASDSPALVPTRFAGRLPVDPTVIAGLYR